jgi:hypothetical protein
MIFGWSYFRSFRWATDCPPMISSRYLQYYRWARLSRIDQEGFATLVPFVVSPDADTSIAGVLRHHADGFHMSGHHRFDFAFARHTL